MGIGAGVEAGACVAEGAQVERLLLCRAFNTFRVLMIPEYFLSFQWTREDVAPPESDGTV